MNNPSGDEVGSFDGNSVTGNNTNTLIQHAPDPTVFLDEELEVLLWNNAAEDFFGWQEEETLGKRAPLFADETVGEVRDCLDELVPDTSKEHFETVCLTKAGEKIDVSVSATMVDTPDNSTRYLLTFRESSHRPERATGVECSDTDTIPVTQVIEGLRPLNRVIAEASTPEEIEQGVCEELVTSDAYVFAWFGDYNPTTGRVNPQRWAGIDTGTLDDIDVNAQEREQDNEAITKAIETRTVQVARDGPDGAPFETWPENGHSRGYQAFAALPVLYEETLYGVIGLYSGWEKAFTEREQQFLHEIGELIGHAIHAAETSRLLHSETVVELEYRTRGTESVFVEMTEKLDCRFELEAFIPASETAFLAYANIEGTKPDAVVEYFKQSTAIAESRVIHSDGKRGTIEYKVKESPVSKLLEYGATVKSAIIEDGEETVTAEVAPDADFHQITAGLENAYSNTTLVSKRSVEREPKTISSAQDPLGEVLTDRQREVLELAYYAGFFESPRLSTGNEIADSMDISSPTFYLHVRKATQNLLEWLDERGLFE